MKTKKITIILGLALILLGTNLMFAANTGNNTPRLSGMNLVRYKVNTHLSGELRLCNLWVVKVTDAYGNLVAPAQGYSTANDTYIFYEKGPVTGTRVARLVMSNPTMQLNCVPEFSAYPDFKTGTFANGQTVTFDLYLNSNVPPKP